MEDTLWIYYGESRTARLADLRTIIPRHIQRTVEPFTIYAVPQPRTAQCTHSNPRCAQPCAVALQQPLPSPTYRGGIYLGTIPGDLPPYLLPAADLHHAIPLNLVDHLAVGPSPFQRLPRSTPSDRRPPDEPTHATPGPKRAIALLTLKAEATMPRDLEGENHLIPGRTDRTRPDRGHVRHGGDLQPLGGPPLPTSSPSSAGRPKHRPYRRGWPPDPQHTSTPEGPTRGLPHPAHRQGRNRRPPGHHGSPHHQKPGHLVNSGVGRPRQGQTGSVTGPRR